MPNLIAYAALLIWPLVIIVLFRKLSPERALIWSLLGGYLLLPPGTEFDFPLIPPLNKTSITNLAALLACIYIAKIRGSLLPSSMAGKLLVIAFVISPIATVLTNLEPLFYPAVTIPALRIYDGVSVISQQIFLIIPLLLGRLILRDPKAHRDLIVAYALSGLAYSLPMLLEVRLSPQLNVWIYGYFPHNFAQQMRFGGFRPVVFLGHGLLVAFMAMFAFLAAVVLRRHGSQDEKAFYLLAGPYLFAVLILCKSVGAIIYAAIGFLILRFLGARTQIRIAAALAAIIIAYPILRGADVIPTDDMVAFAAEYSAERAQSLEYRFNNEDVLLEHANKKPLFGWGGWGRNHLYDEFSGRVTTVTDGAWVIFIGGGGWLNYIAVFGLLTLPLFLLWWHARGPVAVPPVTAAMAVLLMINLIDLLPNATLNALTWMMAGALLGYAEALKTGQVRTPSEDSPEGVHEAGATPVRPTLAFSRPVTGHRNSGTRRAPTGSRRTPGSRSPYSRF